MWAPMVDSSPLWQTVPATVQAILTAVAVLLGGWWVLRKREHFPAACLTHVIESARLTDEKRLVHVTAVLTNVGHRLVQVERCWTRIQQVRPLPPEISEQLRSRAKLVQPGEREAAWPTLDEHDSTHQKGEAEIEPGESEEWAYDFVVDLAVELVEVYTYVRNAAKRRSFFVFKRGEIGWSKTTLFHLQGEESNPMAKPISASLGEEGPVPGTSGTVTEVRQLPPKAATPAVVPQANAAAPAEATSTPAPAKAAQQKE